MSIASARPYDQEIARLIEEAKHRGGGRAPLPDRLVEALSNVGRPDVSGEYDAYDGAWNSDVAIANDPQTDTYSGAPRYIQPGQYGNGMLTDVASSYGGFGTDAKLEFLGDPSGSIQDSTDTSNPKFDLDGIMPRLPTTNEVQEVSFEDEGKARKYLDAVAAGIAVGKGGADLVEDLKKGGNPDFKFGSTISSLLKAGGLAGAGLSLVGALLPFLDKQYVYTGAATDNAEKSKALSGNIAGVGAYAQTGTETMNNQAELMEKMADKLSMDADGTFKDPEYAYKAVNQMSLLSQNGPVFMSNDHVALPEMSTGNGQTDIPLPANVFSFGAGTGKSGMHDQAAALVNSSSDTTAAFDNLETKEETISRAGEISESWLDRADRAATSSTHADGQSARESGPTAMMNDVYGQAADLKSAKSRWEDARGKLDTAMSKVMNSDNWESLAKQAGPAIRENYADQQRTSSSDKIQPVNIIINPKLSKDPDVVSSEAGKLFQDMSDRTNDAFDKLYSDGEGSFMADAKAALKDSWIASGKEISPFGDSMQTYIEDAYKSVGRDGKSLEDARADFIEKVENDPTIAKMGNVLAGDGLSFYLSGQSSAGENRPEGKTSDKLTLKSDQDGKLNAGELFDRINVEDPVFQFTLTSADQSGADKEFLTENQGSIDIIKDKWNDWNGKDKIVSKSDLTKIATDEDKSEAERNAAKLLLDPALFAKLDTYGEGGSKGDDKISTLDIMTYLGALEGGRGTQRASDRSDLSFAQTRPTRPFHHR